MIKTFRGILPSGEENKIRLSTKKGKIGYRIVKFQIMPYAPSTQGGENVMKIYKVSQSSVGAAIDFSDGNLLAAALFFNEGSTYYATDFYSIFEQEIFNQDIYITHSDTAAKTCNYYIEIETLSLTDNAAAVSTLRDIRLNPQVGG